MAALGWLLNLGFAGSGVTDTSILIAYTELQHVFQPGAMYQRVHQPGQSDETVFQPGQTEENIP